MSQHLHHRVVDPSVSILPGTSCTWSLFWPAQAVCGDPAQRLRGAVTVYCRMRSSPCIIPYLLTLLSSNQWVTLHMKITGQEKNQQLYKSWSNGKKCHGAIVKGRILSLLSSDIHLTCLSCPKRNHCQRITTLPTTRDPEAPRLQQLPARV